ncbi:MAG: flavodoxin family protein [Methanomassiliicoccaceae archaeon]|nr:flavodoxin family protein [Methanomassiliicoccaceae archaeon]
MKVVALNGSPRSAGNTSVAVNVIFDELEKMGIMTEQIQMYGSVLTPCNDCGSCIIRGDGRCINEDDDMNSYLDELAVSDGIIFASPSYHGGIPGQMKILLERISIASPPLNRLKGKIGCAVSVQGHHGGLGTYSEMIGHMLLNGMIVIGSDPLPILTGAKPGDVMNDKAGISALKRMGKEMGELIIKLKV